MLIIWSVYIYVGLFKKFYYYQFIFTKLAVLCTCLGDDYLMWIVMLFPFLVLERLSVRWGHLSTLIESGSYEEENTDTQEMLEDLLIRMLTREYIDVIIITCFMKKMKKNIHFSHSFMYSETFTFFFHVSSCTGISLYIKKTLTESGNLPQTPYKYLQNTSHCFQVYR